MSNVFIGEKGKYDWTWDIRGSLVYLPKFDAILITRFFKVMGVPEESIADELTIALSHESIHQVICKLVGEKESGAFDNVPYSNMEIEKWLEWR